jgi:hypothetical protein
MTRRFHGVPLELSIPINEGYKHDGGICRTVTNGTPTALLVRVRWTSCEKLTRATRFALTMPSEVLANTPTATVLWQKRALASRHGTLTVLESKEMARETSSDGFNPVAILGGSDQSHQEMVGTGGRARKKITFSTLRFVYQISGPCQLSNLVQIENRHH